MSVFQETLSRLTTISFAHRFGNALEPECKFYRLAADIFNDVAMVMDLLSPAFPKVQRAFVFATSSALRGLCGVAAGSSKASLSAHFARRGNLGELNAVSCQERIFEQDGMMRWLDGDALGYCRMGVRLHDILRAMSGAARPTTRSMRVQNKHFSALLDIFQEVGYILWFDRNTSTVMVTLKRGSNSEDGLLSWIHGLLVAKRCRQYPSQKLVLDNVFKLIRYSRHEAVDLLQEFKDPLRNAGWDLETAALETKGAGIRVSLDLGKGS
ncbi:MAG: hypothetical protein M1831_006652 [Alyxoria varia]|nr:MAG: hypothetical protein M1831_006652 [Alyxoria varia]